MRRIRKYGLIIASVSLLAACQQATLIDRPHVRLHELSVEKIDLDEQTFVLSFDVKNPNPFPLAIREIRYGVKLDGQRFASGESSCELNVAAASDSSFEITVDLNLLRTAPDLLFIVRDGASGAIPYSLEGQFVMDIPTGPEIGFAHTGDIRLSAIGY